MKLSGIRAHGRRNRSASGTKRQLSLNVLASSTEGLLGERKRHSALPETADSQKTLRKAILKAKEAEQRELCHSLDRNVWGYAYKIPMKKFGRSLPIMSAEITRRVVADPTNYQNPISMRAWNSLLQEEYKRNPKTDLSTSSNTDAILDSDFNIGEEQGY